MIKIYEFTLLACLQNRGNNFSVELFYFARATNFRDALCLDLPYSRSELAVLWL